MGIVERFKNYLTAEKHYSKLTVEAYISDIRQFLLYSGIDYNEFVLTQITAIELRSFVMHLMQSGLKSSSVNRKISTLKSLFCYGVRCGVITSNPTDKLSLVKRQKTIPNFVTRSDMERAKDGLLEITDDFVVERDSLIVLFIYATGVRVSELISIDVDDISFTNLEVKVTGKGGKQRIIPLVAILEKKLKNYLKICEKVFEFRKKSLILSKKGRTISRSEVYRVVNQMLTSMGVEGKCSPHVLRHTFATHLLNGGVGIESVRELMGHSNLSATQIYTHNNIGILLEKYKKAHPRATKLKTKK